MSEVTQILSAIEQGDPTAAEDLLPLVYEELRKLAATRLANERPGQTLQATALVHEAYLRLVDTEKGQHWSSRGHFFAAAAEAMRRLLIEAARRKGRIRHGGDRQHLQLDGLEIAGREVSQDIVALSEALDRLSDEQPQVAQVVKLRYFAGLTTSDAAAAMEISVRTANRHWAFAKAWLFQELKR